MDKKYKIFLVVLLIALLCSAQIVPASRYTSGWVQILDGECYTYTHNLGVRPMIVQAWRAEVVRAVQDYGTVQPLEVGMGGPHTLLVWPPNNITVCNYSGGPSIVQVVAEP